MLESLVKKILETLTFNQQRNNEPIIIALCGAADLGKSYLSTQLIKHLNQQGICADHLTLDSFMMERTERLKNGLSGYQIEVYDLEKIKISLANFKENKAILYAPYEHKLGKCSSTLFTIENCSVLILDGLHSMHSQFSGFIDLSIFIYTDDAKLKQIRTEADLTKRGQSIEFSNLHSNSEFDLYKKFIAPYQPNSHLKLYLCEKWVYKLQE